MDDQAQNNLPDPPVQLKAIQTYMKIAKDIERVDPIVSYWLRLFGTETGLKIDKESKESKTFLFSLLTWLEAFKKSNKDNEAVMNQTVGQAHYENFVMALFNKVDTLDRNGTSDKNSVKMFFMAAVLFEAMAVFGPLTEEITQRAKYAKFKAAYIQKCLKTGQTPKPGPVEGSDLEGSGTTDAPPSGENNANQPPVNTNKPSPLPRMPMPGILNDSATDNVGESIHTPTVPKNQSGGSGPAPAIIPPKPSDPFILTPSVPPTSNKPSTPSAAPTMPQSTTSGSTIEDTTFRATNGTPLKPEDILKGQKYCKFATSALQYDDVATAVINLEKALQLLTTGQSPD